MFCSRFEEIEALGTVVLSKTPDAHDVGNEVNVVFSSRFEEIEALGTVVLSKTPDAHDLGNEVNVVCFVPDLKRLRH